MDGFLNVVTGIGTGRDKRVYSESPWVLRPLEFYEQLYAADELAGRIVDSIPNSALRKWIELTSIEDQDAKMAINEKIKSLHLREAMLQAWIWARNYGGSIVYLVSKTGLPSDPLQEGEEIVAAVPLARYDLRIFSSDIESDFASPNYSRPRQYHLNLQMGTAYKGYAIHWTRCIRFDGQLLPRRTYIRNNYWHDSVMNKLFNSVRNYQTSNDNVASLLQDFNTGVYKMKNLASLVSSGKEDLVRKRLEILQFSRSVINSLVLDAEDEDYIDLQRSVNGLADLVRQQSDRLVAATDIPHTVLLGESPDGSNATGNSTTQQWNSYIKSQQENYLRPKLDDAFDKIFNDIDNEFEYKFMDLADMTDAEEADIRNKQANTDGIYLDRGVLDPEEVAESRFGGDKYSNETVLDRKTREEIGPPIPPDQAELMGGGSPDEKTDSETPEDNYASTHTFTGNAEPDLGSGDDNPLPTTSDLIHSERDIPKESQIIGISESYPFREPTVEDIDWLKRAPGKTAVAPLNHGGKLKVGNKESGQKEVTAQEIAKRDSSSTVGFGSGDLYANQQGSEPNSGRRKRVATVEFLLDDKLLMGQRKKTGKWSCPGGHINDGEEPRDGACRELREETGIEVSPDELEFQGVYTVPVRRGDYIDVYHYKVERKNEAIATTGQRDPDKEANQWSFLDRQKIDALVVPNLHSKKDVVMRSRGHTDGGESVFMPRQLDDKKEKS